MLITTCQLKLTAMFIANFFEKCEKRQEKYLEDVSVAVVVWTSYSKVTTSILGIRCMNVSKTHFDQCTAGYFVVAVQKS